MGGIIRYLGEDSERNLYVLNELSKGWRMNCYEGGVEVLEKKLVNLIGKGVGKVTENPHGTDRMLQAVKERDIETKIIRGVEAEEFLKRFIPDIYLKAYTDLPWLEYLDKMKEGHGPCHDKEGREATEAFCKLLQSNPAVIGLPEGGTFYPEVRLCTKLVARFCSARQFRDYDGTKEVHNVRNNYGQIDWIYTVDDKVYIIELHQAKSSRIERGPTRRLRRQILKGSYFLFRNWKIMPIAVKVDHNLSDRRRNVRYTHWQITLGKQDLKVIVPHTEWLKI